MTEKKEDRGLESDIAHRTSHLDLVEHTRIPVRLVGGMIELELPSFSVLPIENGKWVNDDSELLNTPLNLEAAKHTGLGGGG